MQLHLSTSDVGGDLVKKLSDLHRSNALADVKLVCGSEGGPGAEQALWAHKVYKWFHIFVPCLLSA